MDVLSFLETHFEQEQRKIPPERFSHIQEITKNPKVTYQDDERLLISSSHPLLTKSPLDIRTDIDASSIKILDIAGEITDSSHWINTCYPGKSARFSFANVEAFESTSTLLLFPEFKKGVEAILEGNEEEIYSFGFAYRGAIYTLKVGKDTGVLIYFDELPFNAKTFAPFPLYLADMDFDVELTGEYLKNVTRAIIPDFCFEHLQSFKKEVFLNNLECFFDFHRFPSLEEIVLETKNPEIEKEIAFLLKDSKIKIIKG